MTDPNQQDRLAWWKQAKLGMFVHWGCYSVLGRGEQVILRDHMPLTEYMAIADRFKPAEDWADQIADQAERMGAKYVVLTTRHHDGYCLFDTKTDEFNAVKTGPGRDLIAEYVEAVRKRGLKVGLYYSVVNWRWHGFWDPAGYPDDLPKMVQQMHDQVTELMSNYGQVDILWYDVPAVPGSNSPGAFGYHKTPVEQERGQFHRSAELNAKVRQLQPHILINNRSGIPEDFGTPEQHVTADKEGKAWEACMTRNFAPNWANVNHSVADKTTGQILFYFMDAMRKGGNLLFNIGPDERGYVTERDRASLDRLGQWVQRHGEAVFDTHGDSITAGEGQGACYHYGMFTTRDTTAYLTLFFYPRDYLVMSKVGGNLKSAELLTTGEKLTVEPLPNHRYKIAGLPRQMPDDLAAVLKLEFEQPPHTLQWSGAAWLDGKVD
jgi:alpha-L-fucosidase